MSKLATFLRATAGSVAGAGAGVLAVAAVGVGTYFAFLKPNDAVESAAQEIVMPAEEALQADVSKSVAEVVAPVALATEEPATETAEENAVVESVSPNIDEVRSEADGLTILAGRGEPNSKVTLFVNKVENSSVTAGNDGTFAIVAFLEPSSDPQVLSVVQEAGDLEIAAADIILAPQPVIAKVEEVEAAEIGATNVDPVVAESADETTVDVAEPDADVDAKTVDVAGTNVDVEAPKVDITDVSQTEEQKVLVVEPPASATEKTKAEVAILKSDASGVEVINRSSAPELMSNVEIDTISYSEEGDVLLSGRAQSQATSVRVYLDNTVITTLDVDTTGRWRGDLPDVDTGVYTLRVDEVDVEGNVTSRVETPFKREAPEVLDAAAGNGDAPVKAITVQTGATLWAIARDRYGDGMLFVRVFEANAGSIKDPDLIYPGQVFDLPD
ncbi:LysM peptidoglycan-binding domain-containing protein [Ascidiaceihabitans sp.]|nr:LysM peptidoglycan-binding domain-containing protein [Ascidiaceihabitans sp.]